MEKKILGFLLFMGLFLSLPGCVGQLMSVFCPYLSDNAGHCFQRAAVMDGNPDLCEEIEQPAEWKKAGSNPPKDKCFLMIAEKTGDESACQYIVGGFGSYTKEECYQAAAKSRQ
ncbi:MAG: hypothetical protein ACOZAR_04410 [Patescibacteria group bacterium]